MTLHLESGETCAGFLTPRTGLRPFIPAAGRAYCSTRPPLPAWNLRDSCLVFLGLHISGGPCPWSTGALALHGERIRPVIAPLGSPQTR